MKAVYAQSPVDPSAAIPATVLWPAQPGRLQAAADVTLHEADDALDAVGLIPTATDVDIIFADRGGFRYGAAQSGRSRSKALFLWPAHEILPRYARSTRNQSFQRHLENKYLVIFAS
jgi:hypothetical protein